MSEPSRMALVGARVASTQQTHAERWQLLSELGSAVPAYVGATVKDAWAALRGSNNS